MNEYIFFPLMAVRIAATCAIVLFAPGYALSLIFFEPGRLDFLERGFLAMAASIAISSLAAAGLLLIIGEIKQISFIAPILLVTIIFYLGALLRARWVDKAEQSKIPPQTMQKKIHFALIILVLLGAVGFTTDLPYGNEPGVNSNMPSSSGISEFYISSQYVDRLLAGSMDHSDSLVVPLGIVNHNDLPESYNVVAVVDGEKIKTESGIKVDSGAKWEGTLEISLSASIREKPLDIYLFLEKAEAPVAQLRLWP